MSLLRHLSCSALSFNLPKSVFDSRATQRSPKFCFLERTRALMERKIAVPFKLTNCNSCERWKKSAKKSKQPIEVHFFLPAPPISESRYTLLLINSMYVLASSLLRGIHTFSPTRLWIGLFCYLIHMEWNIFSFAAPSFSRRAVENNKNFPGEWTA